MSSLLRNLLLIAMGALIATFVILHYQPCRRSDLPVKRIAILVPAIHAAMDEIVQGFNETMRRSTKLHYDICIYNAQGNKTLLHAQAEELLAKPFDLLVTIGSGPSQTVHELATKKQNNTPHIFVAVDDPVKLGLAQSIPYSGTNCTGVLDKENYAMQLKLLTLLRPEVKTITLVYDPTQGSGLSKDAERIKDVAGELGLQLNPLEVYNSSDIATLLAPTLTTAQAILVLKDHTVVTAIDTLIKLCNRHGVTLYASDLNSAQKGAALAFGVTEYAFGETAAEQAQAILEDALQPNTTAITAPSSTRLVLNKNAAPHQGLTLDESLMTLLRYVQVIS